MNGYLLVKLLHILAVALTTGGMFARQLVRGAASESQDIKEVASLTQIAMRMDRALVIPASNLMILLGIVLAVMQKWPLFGFLQGATHNWLLVSNVLLVVMIVMIGAIFIPHNKKVESILHSASDQGRLTPELISALHDRRNRAAHLIEEGIILVVAALMVLKPF